MTNEEMWRLSQHFCSPIQNHQELLWAMERIQHHIGRPLKNFLEIGLHGGGSLCMWSQIVADDGHLYGITLEHPSQDFMEGIIPAITGKQFSMINEASELATTQIQLVRMLNGDGLDAIFYDSLHTAEQTAKERELYEPLLASPGVSAFHDIIPKDIYSVSSEGSTGHYFQRIKYDYVYEEMRSGKEVQDGMGIGLLLL